jgi:hypothetical protein
MNRSGKWNLSSGEIRPWFADTGCRFRLAKRLMAINVHAVGLPRTQKWWELAGKLSNRLEIYQARGSEAQAHAAFAVVSDFSEPSMMYRSAAIRVSRSVRKSRFCRSKPKRLLRRGVAANFSMTSRGLARLLR